VYQPLGSLIEPRTCLIGQPTGHDPCQAGCVGYTLSPLTVFPPQGPFGISYFLMIIGEGHFIGFPVSSFCSFVKNLSCREQTVYNQDVSVVLIVFDMYLRGDQVK